MPTNADLIIRTLQCAGVQRLFGMPGGGSPADLIEAASRAGLPFTLAQTETGSAFMAGAQGEITGKPGACVATLGPGVASLANGVAHARLDRIPLVVLTDAYSAANARVLQHQTFSHAQMFAPLVKLSVRPEPHTAAQALSELMASVAGLPPGPVHMDVSSEVTSWTIDDVEGALPPSSTAAPSTMASPSPALRATLARARRPVLIAGLGARSPDAAAAVREFSENNGIPTLVTYKAKGVIPDEDPWFGGVFTNGKLEREVLDHADVFIAVGLDPVELIARPWTFGQPVVSLSPWTLDQLHIPVVAELVGPVAAGLAALDECMPPNNDWDQGALAQLLAAQRERMRTDGKRGARAAAGPLAPHRVVEAVARAYRGARITVDAGAHMFPVMALWPASAPNDALISNGLSTMGFALPAAIGAALLDRTRPTVAFTGDGGLLMCLGELKTAARERVPVRVIVFDDTDLSLITIKQIQRGYGTESTSMGHVDWAAVGSGLGLVARHVADERSLESALVETAGESGPVLIAATVDAGVYPDTMRALRG